MLRHRHRLGFRLTPDTQRDWETDLPRVRRDAAKATASGVDITLRVGEGLGRGYPACAPLFPEAIQAMREVGAFVVRHVNGEGDREDRLDL